jgi:L-alanine-DL-glutamate epimerase-like enolase superfamily enzyme
MAPIKTMEYFRVPPRWLFVKITDIDGNVGWGEATLEGHTQAVEGCLDAWFDKFGGYDAEYGVPIPSLQSFFRRTRGFRCENRWPGDWRAEHALGDIKE